MFVELYAKSDVGCVRRGNEDNFVLIDVGRRLSWTASDGAEPHGDLTSFEIGQQGLVLAVSDGMGGALSGDIASRMAVDSIIEMLIGKEDLGEKFDPAPLDSLVAAAAYANLEIHLRSNEDTRCAGMGATLTGAAVTQGVVELIQVGDSRAYLIRGDEIRQVTKDQSLVQQLLDVGQISEPEIETHMFRNVILQALGAQSEVYLVQSIVRLRRRDMLLLCSDGLWGKLRAAEIYNIAANNSDLGVVCDELIAEANQRGGEDNITVILARFTGDDLDEPNERIVIELPPSDEDCTLDDDFAAETERPND